MEGRLEILKQQEEKFFKELFLQWDKVQTLEYQRAIFGDRLQKPLPISSDYPPSINPLFLPFIGRLLDDFCALLSSQENSQDGGVIGVAKASGCGKTKLAYSLALEKDRLVFLIRLQYKHISNAVLDVEHFFRVALEKLKDPFRAAKVCLNAVRLMVLVHVDWGLHVVEELQKRKCSELKQREGCLRALQNGFGEDSACMLLKHFLNEQFILIHDELVKEYRSRIISALKGKNPVFFFDEIASLRGRSSGLFYHWSDFETTKRSGSQDQIEKKKNEEMDGKKVAEQSADLFYAIRIVLEEFNAVQLPKIPQVMADTTFSLWAVIDISTKSPLRRRVARFCRSDSLTVEQMISFLCSYFSFSAEELQVLTSSQHLLKVFEGRPLFFFNDFLPEFLFQLRTHQNKGIEPALSKAAESGFKLSVQSFSERLQLHMHNTTNPEPKQVDSIFSLLDQIYFAVMMNEGKLKVSNAACRELIEKGFLCTDPKEDMASQIDIEITEEPFCKALKNAYSQSSFSRMCNFLFGRNIDAKESEKGTLGEQILSFYFLQQKWRGGLFSDAIAPLVPKDFGLLHIESWEINLEYGVSHFTDSKHFLERCFQNGVNIQVLLHRVPPAAGPDIAFVLHHKFEPGKFAVVLLQCKVQKEVDLFHAISSIDPGKNPPDCFLSPSVC